MLCLRIFYMVVVKHFEISEGWTLSKSPIIITTVVIMLMKPLYVNTFFKFAILL